MPLITRYKLDDTRKIKSENWVSLRERIGIPHLKISPIHKLLITDKNYYARASTSLSSSPLTWLAISDGQKWYIARVIRESWDCFLMKRLIGEGKRKEVEIRCKRQNGERVGWTWAWNERGSEEAHRSADNWKTRPWLLGTSCLLDDRPLNKLMLHLYGGYL